MDRRLAPSRWKRVRSWLPWCAAVLCIAALFAALRLAPGAGSLAVSRTAITTGTVVYAPFQDYLPVRATVAPLRTVLLTAAESGTVRTVSVLDGASVREGDQLAGLNNPQLQRDVQTQEAAIVAQLGNATAQRLTLQQTLAAEDNTVSDTAYQLLKAQRDLAIRQQLHAQNFESDAGVRSFSDEVDYYRGRLTALRADQAKDRAVAKVQSATIDQTADRLRRNLDAVEASLSALVLRAPVAGRLTAFPLQPGQTVHQGDTIGQIDSEDAFRLDADIDEFYLGRVNEGEAATALIDGVQASLHVARVHPQVTAGQFRIELTFDGPVAQGLRRGEGVEARITLGRTESALLLPNGPWAEGATNIAFVLDRNGRAADQRTIAIGRRNPEQVEIKSGLAAGETVITSSTAGDLHFQRLLIR